MDLWAIHLPLPFILAVVATLGYLFGRRRQPVDEDVSGQSRRELRRAQLVAAELEKIAWELRKGLAQHNASVTRFKDRLGKLNDEDHQGAWKDLCREAEEILKPTLRLAAQISNAHEEIRQQSASLMTFTEVRTDPLTGVNNRRGLDDALSGQFAMMNRYDMRFSVAMFDIDHFKRVNDQEGHLFGDRILQRMARLLDESVRETDVVARYGGEEFVVVMPETELEGAGLFAERLRMQIAQEMVITVSGGVTEALDGDTQDSVLARADAALYQAKTAGRNCVFQHDGEATAAITACAPVADA